MPRSPKATYEFDPYILLMGCQPWPPRPDPGHPRRCPVCKALPPTDARRSLVCAWCHDVTPPLARFIRSRRAARNTEAGDVADAERRAREHLKARHGRSKLSEHFRRELWLGVGSKRDPDYNEKRQAARTWLREIGQTPDWSLILDRRGNVIGRVECEPAPESCSPCPTPACGSA